MLTYPTATFYFFSPQNAKVHLQIFFACDFEIHFKNLKSLFFDAIWEKAINSILIMSLVLIEVHNFWFVYFKRKHFNIKMECLKLTFSNVSIQENLRYFFPCVSFNMLVSWLWLQDCIQYTTIKTYRKMKNNLFFMRELPRGWGFICSNRTGIDLPECTNQPFFTY